MLNEQVERLCGSMFSVNVADTSNAVSDGITKKRKVSVKHSNTTPINMIIEMDLLPKEGSPLRRMNSLESNLMIDELKEQDASDLQNFDWLQSPSANEQPQMDEDILDCIGMDEFDLASTPRPAKTEPAGQSNQSTVTGGSATPAASIPIANPVVSNDSPATSLPVVAAHDIAMFLECLTPELKVRFVDKLAEYTSMQMLQNRNMFPIAAATAEAMPFSPSDEKHDFYLPSGNPAPRIALPLASAALSAFMMSSMQLNPPSGKSTVSVNTGDAISSRG
jgi:hypothetical protein